MQGSSLEFTSEFTSRPTPHERNMAVISHGSILLSFLVAVSSGGLGTLVAMLVPFFIWLYYRHRSSYIAYHALQATLFQLVLMGVILGLSVVLGLVLTLVWVITVLLSIFIVGLVLIPVAVILTLVGGTILLAAPLAGLAYGLIGAWQVYNDQDFRYRWIAEWLERRPVLEIKSVKQKDKTGSETTMTF